MNSLITKIRLYFIGLIFRQRYKVICRMNKCLSAGHYQLIYSNRRYYFVNVETPDEVLKHLNIDRNYKIGSLFNVKESTLNRPVGQIALITTNGFKVFNYAKQEVYCLGLTSEMTSQLESAIQVLSPYYNLTYKEILQDYSIEKMIFSLDNGGCTHEEMKIKYYTLCESYLRYLGNRSDIEKDIKQLNNYTFFTKLLPESTISILNFLKNRIDFNDEYEFVFQHGDMHFGNMLFAEGEYWLLDLEDARKDIFFYDLFNPLFVELTDHNDPILIDLYFTKDLRLMSLFRAVFSSCSHDFNEELLIDYFYLFLYARLIFQIRKKQIHYKGLKYKKKVEASTRNVLTALNYLNKFA